VWTSRPVDAAGGTYWDAICATANAELERIDGFMGLTPVDECFSNRQVAYRLPTARRPCGWAILSRVGTSDRQARRGRYGVV